MTPVTIINDGNFEPTEYFTVSIIPDPNERIFTIEGQGIATAFILDDDSELLMHDMVAVNKPPQILLNHKILFFLRHSIWIW